MLKTPLKRIKQAGATLNVYTSVTSIDMVKLFGHVKLLTMLVYALTLQDKVCPKRHLPMWSNFSLMETYLSRQKKVLGKEPPITEQRLAELKQQPDNL